jgi:hypothetical protein
MLFLQKSSINANCILGGLPPITKFKNWGKNPLFWHMDKHLGWGKKIKIQKDFIYVNQEYIKKVHVS